MPGFRKVSSAMIAMAALIAWTSPGTAQTTSPAPAAVAKGDSARGAIVLEAQDAGGVVSRFTIADLEGMASAAFTTSTPWHDGKVRFEGVPLNALFQRLGVSSSTVMVEAINGYVIEFPVEDARKKPVILAYKANGRYMAVRDKGPLFIVYDYDSDTALNSDAYHARSVWQVRAMRAH